MKHRLLSVMLVMALSLSLLPVNALALDMPDLDVLEDVVAAVEEAGEEPAVVNEETAPVLESGGDVAINEENFPDDIFRAYVQEEFDDDGDWMLSEEELNVKGIDCSNMGIATLEGIEYFTKLGSLNCVGNNLKILDGSNIPGLVYLYCDDNMLENLDISNCSKLVFVHCTSNRLESLDVSGSPNLERLFCSHNNLVSLDVSDNPSLGRLLCEGNNLSYLDIRNNPYLVDWVINGEYQEQEEHGRIAYGKIESYGEELFLNPYLAFDASVTLIDGIPDAAELTALMKHIVGEEELAGAMAYDYNDDGVVDILDVIRLVRYLSGEEVELN